MAEPGVFSAFGNYGAILTWVKYFGIFLGMLIVAGIIVGLILWIVIMAKSTRVVELNLISRKLKFYRARLKKNVNGIKMLWIPKLKKYIPKVDESDKYIEGKREVVILIKDDIGMHHTARLPTYEEIKEWYMAVYDVDITHEKFSTIKQKYDAIYMIPNPSEDCDFLGDQVIEAKRNFASAWWQSPTVMVMATVAMCVTVFIVTLIIAKKM